ncbi:HpcH/HpaI aldolase/citrate lyase family protein [Cochlodiniinecator piscidefendens]|uniref:HpcH/HpaI aldolase/citrate lyase family protein n=1 Tax=Cochlodiniinecator piscidefendens TaxID=2715756 RepID=UPI00140AA2B7|nr:CoA ester lyase [Cochlodiniinecator piscidefendens]
MIRSYLFTPAHQEALVRRAQTRGADVVLLDLEDSVPLEQKSAARQALFAHVTHLRANKRHVAIRVNRALAICAADLRAACVPGVSAVMIPKVSGADHIKLLDEFLSQCEREAGLPDGQIKLIALIETPTALLKLPEIATASPRLSALALGTEDLSTECGFSPSFETLLAPSQQVIFAARAAGLAAVGLPGSIAEVQNMERFSETAKAARRIGFDAVLCIHPKQVTVVNETFKTNANERAEAERIIAAYEAALHEKRGAVLLDGKMIDPPIVARAQALLAST